VNLSLTSDCWFIEEQDFPQIYHTGRLVNDWIAPYAYFSRLSKIGETTLEGYIGRYGSHEDYHNEMRSNFTYLRDFQERKPVYLTFDKTLLYQIVEIYTSKPLLFTIKRIDYLSPDKLMINQESIYQLIFAEKWPEIIDLLHKYKKDINSDPTLNYAAKTFEDVFLSKISGFPMDDASINHVLELLYTIHFGKFYTLKDENLKKLTIALSQRTPLKEAYNYALKCPEDDICKEIINRFKLSDIQKKERPKALKTYNWTEIYNRLFELINNQGDAATYFSGPRFIDAVKEFDPYFSTYSQYIQLRNENGKSTSRKIFYYDILMELDEIVRIRVIEKILSIIKPFTPDKAKAIEMLLGVQELNSTEKVTDPKPVEQNRNPVVFISYSWDDDDHKDWVLSLAKKLSGDGIKVLLDRFDLKAGRSLPHFVEQSIANSDRVLIIFTPGYKSKADNRSGGVGYEYSIVNADLYRNQTTNEKIIPVLRIGEMTDSIPAFMQQFIHLDLRNDNNFENSYVDLLREIYDEPAIPTPQIGSKPDLSPKA
jgi:hypothetical protein